MERGNTAFKEVREIIRLPAFIAETAALEAKIRKTVELDPIVVQQLHSFVSLLSTMYKSDVPFHNFEHARYVLRMTISPCLVRTLFLKRTLICSLLLPTSHVTQSVVKMLSRIVAPDEVLSKDTNERVKRSMIHDHT